ncbi:MAG: TetR/AcrR family transcriptional regulator [Desulfobacteraceae bacterium]|nr:MAG: TetR/AcrR family transcriptional regulator [Desulfobacteraceae bacterium]
MGDKNDRKSVDEQTARRALLVTATELFAKKGYASVSVREIVEAAGMTKPMLYYYFSNKEGLFRSILDWGANIQEEILVKATTSEGTVLDRLSLLYRSTYERVLEHMDFFRLIHNLVFGPPQGAPQYDLDVYHVRMMEAIKAIYLDGVEKGEVRREDPDEVAALIMGVIDFCFHTVFLHPEHENYERPERLLRIAFKGLQLDGAEQ